MFLVVEAYTSCLTNFPLLSLYLSLFFARLNSFLLYVLPFIKIDFMPSGKLISCNLRFI